MRLLMTADTAGGVWTFAKELAAGLLDHHCDVLLVSFGRRPSPEQQRDMDALSARGRFRYVFSTLPLEWMPRNKDAYRAAEPLLLSLCTQFRPDALLLSQFCFGALPVAVPKIVIAHSDVLSWAAAVGKAPLKEDRWLREYRPLVEKGLRGADLLVAPTRATLLAMSTHLPLPHNTAVIANGRSLPDAAFGSARFLRAISAGRMWDPAKNLNLLCAVASTVPILVAGEHDEQVPVPKGLNMVGQLPEERLLVMFRETAMYICCSVYEPFGLAPLEAALCGCAVLANDIPTLREVWGDGALYFHDATGLSQVMRDLADQPEHLRAAQQRSHLRARQYSTARMAEGYLHAAVAAVASRRGSSARAA